MRSKQGQQSKARENARKAAKAANTAKQAVKAGQKIAAGNYIGAAKEILKDENMRKLIIVAAAFLVCIPIMMFSMVPSVIFLPVESAYSNETESVSLLDIISGLFHSDTELNDN